MSLPDELERVKLGAAHDEAQADRTAGERAHVRAPIPADLAGDRIDNDGIALAGRAPGQDPPVAVEQLDAHGAERAGVDVQLQASAVEGERDRGQLAAAVRR